MALQRDLECQQPAQKDLVSPRLGGSSLRHRSGNLLLKEQPVLLDASNTVFKRLGPVLIGQELR